MFLYTLATKVSRPVLHLRVKCRHQRKAVARESMFLEKAGEALVACLRSVVLVGLWRVCLSSFLIFRYGLAGGLLRDLRSELSTFSPYRTHPKCAHFPSHWGKLIETRGREANFCTDTLCLTVSQRFLQHNYMFYEITCISTTQIIKCNQTT